MNPEEKALLEQSLKLSEENHRILLKLQRAARWNTFWSVIKILVFILPLIAGYFYLQPYLGQAAKNYGDITNLLKSSAF